MTCLKRSDTNNHKHDCKRLSFTTILTLVDKPRQCLLAMSGGNRGSTFTLKASMEMPETVS